MLKYSAAAAKDWDVKSKDNVCLQLDTADTGTFNQADLARLVFALVVTAMKYAIIFVKKDKDEDYHDDH